MVFGNVERKKNILLEELRVVGVAGEGRALGVEESMKKAKIVSDLEKKSIGGKNLGSCGSRRVTSAQSFTHNG